MYLSKRKSNEAHCLNEVPLKDIDYFKCDYHDCAVSLPNSLDDMYLMSLNQDKTNAQATAPLKVCKAATSKSNAPTRSSNEPSSAPASALSRAKNQSPTQAQAMAQAQAQGKGKGNKSKVTAVAKSKAQELSKDKAMAPKAMTALAPAKSLDKGVNKGGMIPMVQYIKSKSTLLRMQNFSLEELADGKRLNVMLPVGRPLPNFKQLKVANEPITSEDKLKSKATGKSTANTIGKTTGKAKANATASATVHSSAALNTALSGEDALEQELNDIELQDMARQDYWHPELKVNNAYLLAKDQEQLDLERIFAFATALKEHHQKLLTNYGARLADNHSGLVPEDSPPLTLNLKFDTHERMLSIYLADQDNHELYGADPNFDLISKTFPLTINYEDVYMKCLNHPNSQTHKTTEPQQAIKHQALAPAKSTAPAHTMAPAKVNNNAQAHSTYQARELSSKQAAKGADRAAGSCASAGMGAGAGNGNGASQSAVVGAAKGKQGAGRSMFFQRSAPLDKEAKNLSSCPLPHALNSTYKRNIELNEFKSRISTTAMMFISMGLAFISLAAFISRSMDTTVVPYVVTVDTHGVVRGAGVVDQDYNYMHSLPEQVISAQLCNFISDMRMVTPDKNMQKKALSHVFSCLKRDSKVFNQLQSAFEKSNPLDPNAKQEVQVEIANVIPLDQYTYQIDWLEKHSNSDELDSREQKMRALISYEISSGYYQDPNLLMLNPLNLFVKELVLSPIIA